jgi:hypothetical protein
VKTPLRVYGLQIINPYYEVKETNSVDSTVPQMLVRIFVNSVDLT